MSHLKVPLFGILNFAGVFFILYFTDVVTFSTALIGTLTGLIVGIFTELIFHKRPPHKRRRRLPTTVSTKFILIPSILLLALIAFSFLFMTGNNPFETEGHTTKENVEAQQEELPIEEEIVEEEIVEEEKEEEDPNEICTISDNILCVEHKVEGSYKRAMIKIENKMAINMQKVRAYVNEDGVDKFLCKLYCVYGCHGSTDDEIPAGGIATFIGDQYCRFDESGELTANTKIVYENNAGTEFTEIGTLKTQII